MLAYLERQMQACIGIGSKKLWDKTVTFCAVIAKCMNMMDLNPSKLGSSGWKALSAATALNTRGFWADCHC